MKARVKKTGEIGIVANIALLFGNKGYRYQSDEVEIIDSYADIETDKEPDYWEKLKHQYAGMAMQAMISNSHNTDYHKDWSDGYGRWRKYDNKELAEMAIYYATALVEKLKNE